MDVYITHISTACVLLEIGQVRILTDPIFDTGVKKYWAAPLVPFTRSAGPALPPESMTNLDAVLLSHPHHADNLDDGGRAVLKNAREVITAAEEVDEVEGRVTGLRAGGQATIFGRGGERITVTGTPALHGPGWLPGFRLKPSPHLAWDARHVRGFLLEWPGQENGALYISGDTVYFPDLSIATEKVGTAIVHLGAATFWPFRYTFNAAEVVKWAKQFRQQDLKCLVPIHYEQSVWSHFKEDVGTYHRAFRDAGLLDKVKWLQKGTRTRLPV